VSLVEQELLTLPDHLSSPPVFSGVRATLSLVLYICLVDRCLTLCTFSFGHCVLRYTDSAATLYQGNPDRNHKLWNIVSTERYILHMQVLLECCYIWMKSSQWENWNHLFCRKVSLLSMEYPCYKWPLICSTCRKHFPVLSSFMTYHRVCN
jgi:hypothetical protein